MNFNSNSLLIDFFVSLNTDCSAKYAYFFLNVILNKKKFSHDSFFVFFSLLVLTTRLPTAHRCSVLSKFADTFYLQIDKSLPAT